MGLTKRQTQDSLYKEMPEGKPETSNRKGNMEAKILRAPVTDLIIRFKSKSGKFHISVWYNEEIVLQRTMNCKSDNGLISISIPSLRQRSRGPKHFESGVYVAIIERRNSGDDSFAVETWQTKFSMSQASAAFLSQNSALRMQTLILKKIKKAVSSINKMCAQEKTAVVAEQFAIPVSSQVQLVDDDRKIVQIANTLAPTMTAPKTLPAQGPPIIAPTEEELKRKRSEEVEAELRKMLGDKNVKVTETVKPLTKREQVSPQSASLSGNNGNGKAKEVKAANDLPWFRRVSLFAKKRFWFDGQVDIHEKTGNT